MEEQLISFETAKLAKEKGLKHPILKLDLTCCDITQSLLQKWLREEYNLDIEVYSNHSLGHKYYTVLILQLNRAILEHKYVGKMKYLSYESALEEALINGLNLI